MDDSIAFLFLPSTFISRFEFMNSRIVGEKLFIYDDFSSIDKYFFKNQFVLPFTKIQQDNLDKKVLFIDKIYKKVCNDLFETRKISKNILNHISTSYPSLNRLFYRRNDNCSSTIDGGFRNSIPFALDLITEKDTASLIDFKYGKTNKFRIGFYSSQLQPDMFEVVNYFSFPNDYYSDFEYGEIIYGHRNLEEYFANLICELISVCSKYEKYFASTIKYVLFRFLQHAITFYEEDDEYKGKYRIAFYSSSLDLERFKNCVSHIGNNDIVHIKYDRDWLAEDINIAKHSNEKDKKDFNEYIKNK